MIPGKKHISHLGWQFGYPNLVPSLFLPKRGKRFSDRNGDGVGTRINTYPVHHLFYILLKLLNIELLLKVLNYYKYILTFNIPLLGRVEIFPLKEGKGKEKFFHGEENSLLSLCCGQGKRVVFCVETEKGIRVFVSYPG